MSELNETHDPAAASWVESANNDGSDFPIQNLPLGVYSHPVRGSSRRIGTAIGGMILDLQDALSSTDTSVSTQLRRACQEQSLNALMSLPAEEMSTLRLLLHRLLRSDSRSAKEALQPTLVPQTSAQMHLPAEIGDYTDFYASIQHATNVGALFRPDNPLLPNYKWVPIGYHGRSSSIVVSGTPVKRPAGQARADDAVPPEFRPSRALDYELEVGAFIAGGNRLGEPIEIENAASRIFGLCLLNDWSARDIQKWEYQPLGPFLGKNFATTISPWVVTRDALLPFRSRAAIRSAEDPAPLPYLSCAQELELGSYSLELEVTLSTRQMRAQGISPHRLSRCNFSSLYWTFGQMIAHHTSNGCNLRPGDLLGSGTVSGAGQDERGCLLEITSGGKTPVLLPDGEERRYLQEGDQVTLKGRAQRSGYVAVGFGECRGEVC